MQMGTNIEQLLCIRIDYRERFDMGRVLLSALTRSGLYRLVREDEEKNDSPHVIVATGKGLPDRHRFERTKFEPFPPWTAPFDADGNRLVEPSYPCPAELEYDPQLTDRDGSLFPWVTAVHKLESVAYRINDELLDLVIELDKKSATRVIPKTDPNYKRKRTQLDRKFKEFGISKLQRKKKNKKPLTTTETKAWNSYWREHYLIEQTKERIQSRRRTFDDDLQAAKKLRGKTFYQRVLCDYRGRMSLPTFSYQGSDFARAVIEFDSGEIITKSGWEHLFRHTSSVQGLSADIGEKIKNVSDISSAYADIALDPIGTFVSWTDADKPFCFLRACMEIRDGAANITKLDMKKNPAKYKKATKDEQKWAKKLVARHDQLELSTDGLFVSHLPCELDQSNSAFQHIAGMMNDDQLRQQSNMYGDDYTDLYKDVARSLDIDETESGLLPDDDEKRKIVKKVAIPWGYGAESRTCADDLLDLRKESPHKTKYLCGLTVAEINDLADRVWNHLNHNFQTCVDYFNEVKRCVRAVRDQHQQNYMAWVTPSWFVVAQRVHTSRRIQRRVWSGEPENKDVEVRIDLPTDTIDWGSNITKTPPNLVHSYDATLIHAVLWAGKFESVRHSDDSPAVMIPKNDGQINDPSTPHQPHYDVITIHDAFSCHASNSEDLLDKLRVGLALLYTAFDPMELFRWMTEGDQFRRRNIDFTWVNRSRNTFN